MLPQEKKALSGAILLHPAKLRRAAADFEWLKAEEFPHGFGALREELRPLNAALDELRAGHVGEGVRLRLPEGISKNTFQKRAHTYAERRGLFVRTRFYEGWFYIQKREKKARA